jgi:hypothetical protein
MKKSARRITSRSGVKNIEGDKKEEKIEAIIYDKISIKEVVEEMLYILKAKQS